MAIEPNEHTPLLNLVQETTQAAQVDFEPISRDQDKKKSLVSIKQLFRFSDRTDVILLTLAFTGSILYGIITPAQFILFGKLVDDFVDYVVYEKTDISNLPDLEKSTTQIAVWYVGLAVGNFLFAWMGMGLFALSAERQVHKMRLAMFRNVIYQEIGWFDEHSSGELNTRFTEDLSKIADGIGSKLGRVISSVTSFVGGYVIGFVLVRDLTLILLAILPFVILVGGVMAKVTGNYASEELRAYSKAGKIAEQSISSIRTVAAFGGEEKQTKLYDEHLDDACKFGIRKGFSIGLGIGSFQLVVYSDYALSVWYIIKLARETEATPGRAIAVFFAVTMASMILAQSMACFQAFAIARGAADVVFNIIDRESKIDASSNTGLKPAIVKGDIEFSHVGFMYPTRPSVEVLKDFSLKVPSGKRVALVGESGCGKSTIVKLVQRFYDPVEGTVLLDGQDIKSLNVSHLRSLIGVVNQEPVLFATTIAENIASGHEGATQREIEEAAKMANVHNFICGLPKGYNTLCGDRGVQMSGGQKQRIAIARALVRNPKILLLDEATSALDIESEAVVQEALDKAGEGRTTVVIAHRLSTIKNADIIVAVRDGRVAEMGTHDELMALDGFYSTLVKLQVSYGDDFEDDYDDWDDAKSFEIGEDRQLKLTSYTSTVSQLHTRTFQPDDEDAAVRPISFLNILKRNAPEWKYLLIGCVGAALYGIFPFLYGIAFGGVLHTMRCNPRDPVENQQMKDEATKYALFYFLIGVESGLGIFLQNWCFAEASEALTKRLRKQAFSAFLRQDMAYFDHPNHGTVAICTRLAQEVSTIQGATGPQLGLVVSALFTIVGGLIVAFYASWQLSLVMMGFVPLLLIAGMLMKFFIGSGDRSAVTSGSGHAAEEALSSIQTVASLGRENDFFERYRQATMKTHRKAKRLSHVVGVATGSFMAIVNLSFAVAFRFGGYLVTEGDVTLRNMMISIFTVILSAIIVGQVAATTPDYAQAKQAAGRIFSLLERVPSIDCYSNEGKQPVKCNGKIRFANVRFRYPTRRNLKVLRDFSLTLKPGQTVALVGTSGCGKSTSVSLVERFYDVDFGHVMVDACNIQDLNLKWLRSQIGTVSQEPVLFDLSIRDNIAYGDTTRNVSNEEIEDAAKSANVHQFILSLPKGYDTIVGDKGTLISGGQKQRIAIARALIRNPKILLLDEATSALDTGSEKIVQKALDKASIGRTTIIITHRLSTIQHADVIVVIKSGRVVERGTHQQLLALKGIYHALHKAQSTSVRQT